MDYVSEALLAYSAQCCGPWNRIPGGTAGLPVRTGEEEIAFSADNVAGELRMTISDDGKGIDEERVRERGQAKGLFAGSDEEYDPQKIREFILYPGFSTNETVTEYSGRGRGAGCGKEHHGGRGRNLSIRSTIGQGSAFSISVPLNLASIECVRFRVGPVPLLHTGPACISFSGVWSPSGDRFVKLTDGITSCMKTG
ncbi:MAG: ATP-binding protein [Acutalibacteraceae bacterium]